ncbi:hypothetical protein PR048_018424 [Dryococelus australis]|uniref:Uncharacterized protein n=1 Tax=Dryococelus australis TaxID=614101 RepID=A0ABQ9HC88_9NEOP|nr:hypothetical protein PR048_018424 [Dryococelus australis]
MIWMSMAREMNLVNWGWKLDGEELVPTLYCKLYSAIVKLAAAVTVAVAAHMDFHAVMYMDHVKLRIMPIRCQTN